jgi:histidinol-phosphate aminotransferase
MNFPKGRPGFDRRHGAGHRQLEPLSLSGISRLLRQACRDEGLTADQILVGAGSSEPLHAAVEAFTSPTVPLIIPMPTYEAAPELTKYKGHPVIETPLNSKMAPDVRRLAAEAEKAGGGLIYIVNPNNPTSTITTSDDMAWLVANLPKNTNVLVDEAYIHYATSPEAPPRFAS